MAYEAEAAIAGELLKFAMNGSLYRGSKPVMWSVVEGTALAEAEVEYHEHQSPAIWVKFPVQKDGSGKGKGKGKAKGDVAPNIVIWTTTPWTIPGNRAISFSKKIEYGLFEVTDAPEDNWAKAGERFLLAKKLAPAFFRASACGEMEASGGCRSHRPCRSTSAERTAAMTSMCRCWKAITSPRKRARASCIPHRAMVRTTSTSGRQMCGSFRTSALIRPCRIRLALTAYITNMCRCSAAQSRSACSIKRAHSASSTIWLTPTRPLFRR